MSKTVLIRISLEDAELLKNDCTNEFLSHHTEFENIPISYQKIVHEAIKFYLLKT